jgi:hypothetical protein
MAGRKVFQVLVGVKLATMPDTPNLRRALGKMRDEQGSRPHYRVFCSLRRLR